MPADFLHNHKEFPELIRIVAEKMGIAPVLVEKDYWIMHALYGLKSQGYDFQLKGGTSLSKGFGLIDRFSEDIDIHINPPKELGINENPKNSNSKNIQRKKDYYDRLREEIKIDGFTEVVRDTDFDDKRNYNSGGIRLFYDYQADKVSGLKDGILLEAGYDNVAPNYPVTISSWAYERAIQNGAIELIDNRAVAILCYDPRYTFVEKLQTIASKFRKEMVAGELTTNYMRQYYDIYSLLASTEVQAFLGSEEYMIHKQKRFSAADFELPIINNEAFLLSDPEIRLRLQKRYESSRNLYYRGQPTFDEILGRIGRWLEKL